MKPLYRLTYLLLRLVGALLIILFALIGKLTWIITGNNPAMRWFDRYNDWLQAWKKQRSI